MSSIETRSTSTFAPAEGATSPAVAATIPRTLVPLQQEGNGPSERHYLVIAREGSLESSSGPSGTGF